MPNLNDWIEAQLKKGYTRKQVKDALIRKGYSSAAVAEVDKVGYSALPAKTLPSNKIPKKFSYKPIALIGIVIVVVVLVWLFNALPFFSKHQETINEFGITEISSNNLCVGLQNTEGEISCEEAIGIALKVHNGKLISISKDDDYSPKVPTLKDVTQTDVWRITLLLDKPIEKDGKLAEKAIIAVERKTGDIILVYPFSR